MPAHPPVRSVAASRLRALADRLEPLTRAMPRRPTAPLIRLGGRWWYRDELVAPIERADEIASDVQLRPS